ncbi:hypothetical protein GEMRC1_011268 [Eukaryota sp. GEM-RC1]
MTNSSHQSPDTVALHSVGHHGSKYAHATPIYATSTYSFDSPEHGLALFSLQETGHIYSRLGNPSVEAAEEHLASIDKAEGGCLMFASGMGALVSSNCLYGCTYKLFSQLKDRYNIDVTFVDSSNIEEVRNAMKPTTKMVYIESPANPTLSVTDIKTAGEIAHSVEGCLLVVDNTFMSPILQRPLELGADITLYSCTKNLNGHGTSVNGALCFKNKDHWMEMWGYRVITGGNMSPFDAFLVSNGMKTLPMRIRCMSETSKLVAEFLHNHPDIETVYHPSLPSHSGHAVHKKQATGYPSCLAFGNQAWF